jgi:hypothetical protein
MRPAHSLGRYGAVSIRHPRRRRRTIALALGVVAVAASGLSATLLRGDREPVDTGSVRVAASANSITDAQGSVWAPIGSQNDGAAGTRQCSGGTVYGTASPDLYRCALVDVRRLSVPLGRGTYAVTILLAETLGAGRGDRIFDVDAEGTRVAKDVDVAAAVGPQQAYHLIFTVAVADGALDLDFAPRRGSAFVSAVEATRLRASVGPARVVWSDEFDGTAGSPPDPRRWRHDVGAGGWGNNELQTYTRSPVNAHLDGNGHLVLVARRDSSPGGVAYTSARLKTHGLYAGTYGEIAARIRVARGAGLLGVLGPWHRCGQRRLAAERRDRRDGGRWERPDGRPRLCSRAEGER